MRHRGQVQELVDDPRRHRLDGFALALARAVHPRAPSSLSRISSACARSDAIAGRRRARPATHGSARPRRRRSAPPARPRPPPRRASRRPPSRGRRCRRRSSRRARGSPGRGRAGRRGRRGAAAGPCGRGAQRRPRPARARGRRRSSTRRRRRRRSSSAPIAASSIACAPRRRASSSPCASVRFATTATSAPRETRFRAVASLILPAPSSSTGRPARSPKTCCASAAAADGTEAGLSPIAVSSRTRRPAWSACRKSRSSNGPGRARLERGPHLAEDLALARHERVEPGGDAEEMQRGRLVAEAVERGGELVAAVAGELGERPDCELLDVILPDEVELGAVAGGEARPPRRRARAASARQPRRRSSATRSRSSIGARVVRHACRASASCGEVGQGSRTTTRARSRPEPAVQPVARASPRGGARAGRRTRRAIRSVTTIARRSRHRSKPDERRPRSRARGRRASRAPCARRAGRACRAAASRTRRTLRSCRLSRRSCQR